MSGHSASTSRSVGTSWLAWNNSMATSDRCRSPRRRSHRPSWPVTCRGPSTRNFGVMATGMLAMPTDTSAIPGRHSDLRAALQDQLANPLRVGLPLRRLHDRADDRAGRGHFAAADLLHDVRLRGQCLVDGGVQGAVVVHDLETARDDDLVGLALA